MPSRKHPSKRRQSAQRVGSAPPGGGGRKAPAPVWPVFAWGVPGALGVAATVALIVFPFVSEMPSGQVLRYLAVPFLAGVFTFALVVKAAEAYLSWRD
jgi:hypothetical protein